MTQVRERLETVGVDVSDRDARNDAWERIVLPSYIGDVDVSTMDDSDLPVSGHRCSTGLTAGALTQ